MKGPPLGTKRKALASKVVIQPIHSKKKSKVPGDIPIDIPTMAGVFIDAAKSCGLVGRDSVAKTPSADQTEHLVSGEQPDKILAEGEVAGQSDRQPLENLPRVELADHQAIEEGPILTETSMEQPSSCLEVALEQSETMLGPVDAFGQFISMDDDDEEEPIHDLTLPDPIAQDNLQIGSSLINVSQTLSLGPLPDDVKVKLRDMLPFLNQDIGQFVQDAEPIRDIFNSIKGHLPRDIKKNLLQVAFIESQQRQVLEAQNQLEDRTRQE